MNVKKFIEYLETLPENTKIRVIESRDGGYLGIYNTYEPLDIDYNSYFNEISEDPILDLGET